MTDELRDPDNYPHPGAVASYVREFVDDDAHGVAGDSLIEAKIHAAEVEYKMRDIAVMLDGIIDDTGHMPAPLLQSISTMQTHFHALADWASDYESALDQELAELKEEHDDV